MLTWNWFFPPPPPPPPPIVAGQTPTVNQLMNDARVIIPLQVAYDDSKPNTPQVDEIYGYVYYNSDTGGLYPGRVAAQMGKDVNGPYWKFDPPNPDPGYIAVASWHTHPEGFGPTASPDVPSIDDTKTAVNMDMPMIIITPGKVLIRTFRTSAGNYPRISCRAKSRAWQLNCAGAPSPVRGPAVSWKLMAVDAASARAPRPLS